MAWLDTTPVVPFSFKYFWSSSFSLRICLDFLTPKSSANRLKASSIDKPSEDASQYLLNGGTMRKSRPTSFGIAEIRQRESDDNKAQVQSIGATGRHGFEPTFVSENHAMSEVPSEGNLLSEKSYSYHQVCCEAGCGADRAASCSNLESKIFRLIPAEVCICGSESSDEDDNPRNDQTNHLL